MNNAHALHCQVVLSIQLIPQNNQKKYHVCTVLVLIDRRQSDVPCQ